MSFTYVIHSAYTCFGDGPQVRGLSIPAREPLRRPGPEWEGAFFGYLQEMGCPYDFPPGGRGETGAGDGRETRSGLVLRGLSWLVTEAVACDFEDNGKDYMASARQVGFRELCVRACPRPPPFPKSFCFQQMVLWRR